MSTLEDYLSEIADAIRTKENSEGAINAQDFSKRILNISSGEEIKDRVDLDYCVGIMQNDSFSELKYNSSGNLVSSFDNSIQSGSPYCGSKVKSISRSYAFCKQLTGSPVCGNNVTNMIYTYEDCKKINGDFYCGENVINAYGAFSNAFSYYNNGMNHFFNNSFKLNNVSRLYYGKSENRRINVFIPESLNNIFNKTNYEGLTGSTISWTPISDENGDGYCNAAQNIYVYPLGGGS